MPTIPQHHALFVSAVSHPVRNSASARAPPLAVIRSSVELLRRNAARPVGEVGDALGAIDAEVQQLPGLVDDLLLLARSDSGAVALERVPLQLDDVASRAERAALMADGHLGYVMPIGGVAAYRDRVSVVGVGFDIACGNAAVRTDLTLTDDLSTSIDDDGATLRLIKYRRRSDESGDLG